MVGVLPGNSVEKFFEGWLPEWFLNFFQQHTDEIGHGGSNLTLDIMSKLKILVLDKR